MRAAAGIWLLASVSSCRLIAGISDREEASSNAVGGSAGEVRGGAGGSSAGHGGSTGARGGTGGSGGSSAGSGGSGATAGGSASMSEAGRLGRGIGLGFTCALATNGTVRCWGDGRRGQLGVGTTAQLKPEPVPGIAGASRLATGASHACALVNRQAVCWGWNADGQATGTPSPTPVPPTVVPNLNDVLDVAAGRAHSCALSTTGKVQCWGGTGHAQTSVDAALPPTVRLEVGADHSCALDSEGNARCWGESALGRLGSPAGAPVLATGGGPAPPFSELALGAAHSCALARNGKVWCWGDNQKGQLGSSAQGGPEATGYGDDIELGVSAGGGFTCIHGAEGVRCSGDNAFGALGSGDLPLFTPDPTQVGLNAATQVEAYAAHACALLQTGELWCWGDNRLGQLGSGQTDPTPVSHPVRVAW